MNLMHQLLSCIIDIFTMRLHQVQSRQDKACIFCFGLSYSWFKITLGSQYYYHHAVLDFTYISAHYRHPEGKRGANETFPMGKPRD